MNKDIRILLGWLDHPKTIKLERLLGWPGIKSLLRLWFFAAENKPEGVLTGMEEEDIEIAAQWHGKAQVFLSALMKIHWVDRRDGTYMLHDWAEHNAYVIHSRERTEQARKAAYARWSTKGARGLFERDSEHAPCNATSNAPSISEQCPQPVPSPAPFPFPSPKDLKTLKPLAESDEKTIASPPEEKARISRPKTKPPPLTQEEYCRKCAEEISLALKQNREIWGKAYPALNLDQEAAKAVSWLLAHPKERKSLFTKFLNSWLSRAQENARAAPQSSGNGGFRGGAYRRSYSPRDAAKSAALDEAADRINREWRESKHSKPAQNQAHDHAEDDAQGDHR